MSTSNPKQEKENKKEEARKDLHLEFDPIPFKSVGKSMRLTNRDLSLLIKSALGEIFHDLKGVYVGCQPGCQLFAQLYFQDNQNPVPEGKIKNLINIFENNSANSMYEKQKMLNNRFKGKQYQLTDETKTLLKDIMYGGHNIKDNVFNNNVTEVKSPASSFYNAQATNNMVRVSGIDLAKIVRKIFGKKMIVETTTDDGKTVNKMAECLYEVRYSGVNAVEPTIFMINIEQFDINAIQELSNKEIPTAYGTQTGYAMY